MTTSLAQSARIREHFPALSRREGEHAVAFFDGPGGTQVPRGVADAMVGYLLNHNANTHWVYPTSQETDALLARAREAGADLFNADPDEVSFGNNMTTITFHVARALGRAWGPGDEVIVTELDHQANVAPWRAVARERGISVRAARMIPESGTLDVDHLMSLVTPRTRLVAVGAASNALGSVTDIAPIAAHARSVGALTFVDAVHFAAHGIMDVRAWGCDFCAVSPYKFYGPHTGMLFTRREVLASLDVPKLDPAPDEGSERLETGTQNHEGMVGTEAAIDFIASWGTGDTRRARIVNALRLFHDKGEALITRLWQGLERINGVVLHGPRPGSHARTPTLSFSVDGVLADEVAAAVVPHGLYLSSGDFYATSVIAALGRTSSGVVRAGCACYTTDEEVDRLIAAVAALRG